MSISPQMRQLFMELLARELPHFRDGRGIIDKDTLLHSVLDSMNRQYPQQAHAYYSEAAFTMGKVLINEHLRFHQTTFVRGELRRRARQFVQIPLDGSHKFVPKMMTDLTKADVRKMRKYHTDKAGSHDREAQWFATVEEMMDAAGLDENARVSEVMTEAQAA